VEKALWPCVRTLYHEAEARRKDAAKQERAEHARVQQEAAAARKEQVTLKEAVFRVMQAAWQYATGDGDYRVSKRSLYYAVRARIQALTPAPLDYNYFSQDLLTQYQTEHGPLQGLYADPRGVLYEPHTGQVVQLGTSQVDAYTFPAWRYDKILYVEKKGLWPVLQDAQLGERYDMAILAGEGYATEAIRVLFQRATQNQQCQLFVLHDADPDGYNIARTLREETARMPDYAVDVVDLGLTIEDARAWGLQTETFTRKKALPRRLVLSEAARAAFEGRREWKQWVCERVELNAFSAPALIGYIEEGLQRAGVRGKVIPSDGVLPFHARTMRQQALETLARRALAAILQSDTLIDHVARCFEARIPLDEARAWIETALDASPTLSWDRALDGAIRREASDLYEQVEDAVRTALWATVQAGQHTE